MKCPHCGHIWWSNGNCEIDPIEGIGPQTAVYSLVLSANSHCLSIREDGAFFVGPTKKPATNPNQIVEALKTFNKVMCKAMRGHPPLPPPCPHCHGEGCPDCRKTR